MTNLFSKGFPLLLYHLWEILPDSADSNRMLWSGPDVLPCLSCNSNASTTCLGKNMKVWNAPLGIILRGFFIPRHMLRHVKFLIWWKPVCKHFPMKNNCANANALPTSSRDNLSVQLEIADSNVLVLARVQNEMKILQLMLEAFLINLPRIWLQSTCKIWDSRNYPLTEM